MFTLEIRNANNEVLASANGENHVYLYYDKEYQKGDTFAVKSTDKNVYLMLQLDHAMGESFVYMAENEVIYTIPFDEKRSSYSPQDFYGDRHCLSIRKATEDEIKVRKNLALNIYDQHGDPGLFPHAYANVETRGEAVFAARNAINGNCCNFSHGPWPFESWGINMQDDAEITLDFGREVEIDKMTLVTRADFPHDNYWQKVTFTFSDGSTLVWDMEKSDFPHEIPLAEKKRVSWIKLGELIKDPEDPSPFPALTQWMVYGTEV